MNDDAKHPLPPETKLEDVKLTVRKAYSGKKEYNGHPKILD